MALVVVLWVTEALPMAVTALLGPALAIVLQVAPARRALAPFADPIIFLFIGSFILAEAMFVHGLDRRIAFTTLSSRLVGASATRMLVAYGGGGDADLDVDQQHRDDRDDVPDRPVDRRRTSAGAIRRRPTRSAASRIGMMLITSFGASIGGMATPVGTPPNLIGIGMIERLGGRHIDFLAWMRLGVPLVLVLLALLLGVVRLVGRARHPRRRGGAGAGAGRARQARRLDARPAQRPRRLRSSRCCCGSRPGLAAIAGLEGSSAVQTYGDVGAREPSPR